MNQYDNDYYDFVRQHHQDLIKIAQASWNIRAEKSHPPATWDRFLVRWGDLLITWGQSLKEHTASASRSVESSTEPCVDCP